LVDGKIFGGNHILSENMKTTPNNTLRSRGGVGHIPRVLMQG
jgi:hypothetical protein